MNKNDIAHIFKSVSSSITKHSPEILTGIGIAGMIATTIISVKATPKAVRLLEAKKEELDSIEAETAQQVAELMAKAEKAREPIDERLLTAYNRIRSNVRNGLAVVTVTRDACGGCFNRIPPQRQVDIRQGKKLIVCEYCGRILVTE